VDLTYIAIGDSLSHFFAFAAFSAANRFTLRRKML